MSKSVDATVTRIDIELDSLFSLFSLSDWQDARVRDAICYAAECSLPEEWHDDCRNEIAYYFGNLLQDEIGFTVPSLDTIKDCLFAAMKTVAL